MFQKSRETSSAEPVEAQPPSSVRERPADAPAADTRDTLGELEEVERELAAVREQKRRLELDEARLWGRRNHLEQELIHVLGGPWWREHAHAAGSPTSASATPRSKTTTNGGPPPAPAIPSRVHRLGRSTDQRRK